VVGHKEVTEPQLLPVRISVQKAELIALIRDLTLEKRKRLNTYTDSKYAFLVLCVHSVKWRAR
jgi:hypothetical protein